jgi:hypothetical protein
LFAEQKAERQLSTHSAPWVCICLRLSATAFIYLPTAMLVAVETNGHDVRHGIWPAITLRLAMFERRPGRSAVRKWTLAIAALEALPLC